MTDNGEAELAERIEELEQDLKAKYTDHASPIGFSDVKTIYEYFNHELPVKNINHFLSTQDGYTLTRRSRRLKVYNMTYVSRKRENIQMDVFFMSEFKKYNDNIQHILIGVDVFSRFMWVAPLKNTSAAEGIRGVTDIIQQIRGKIENLTVDKGSEFISAKFRNVIKNHGIDLHYTNSKASIAERSILTLKRYVYRYFAQTDNLRYIDKIKDFVGVYNDHFHRFIKMSPRQAEKRKNELKIMKVHAARKATLQAVKRKIRFNIGDKVRVSRTRTRMTRGYDQTNNYEVFEVYKVNSKLPIPRFYIKEPETEEKIIGAFYQNELTLVNMSEFKVTVLKERTRRGVKEYFVKWKGYPGELFFHILQPFFENSDHMFFTFC